MLRHRERSVGVPEPPMKRSDLILVAFLWCTPLYAQNITSFVGSTGSTNVSNSAVNYFPLSGIDKVSTTCSFATPATSTSQFVPNQAVLSWTFSNLYCFSGAAPGIGKSYTIEPFGCGGSAFATTVTISDSATSASDTTHTQDSALVGGPFSFRVTPSGTPTATTISCYIEASIN